MDAPEQNLPGASSNQYKLGDQSHLQIVESQRIPNTSREWTIIAVLAVLLIVSLMVNGLNYARNGRNDEKLLLAEDRATKAETDLNTQIWLRGDSLTKENAELRGHVIAIEDLMQAYGIRMNVRKSISRKQEKR